MEKYPSSYMKDDWPGWKDETGFSAEEAFDMPLSEVKAFLKEANFDADKELAPEIKRVIEDNRRRVRSSSRKRPVIARLVALYYSDRLVFAFMTLLMAVACANILRLREAFFQRGLFLYSALMVIWVTYAIGRSPSYRKTSTRAAAVTSLIFASCWGIYVLPVKDANPCKADSLMSAFELVMMQDPYLRPPEAVSSDAGQKTKPPRGNKSSRYIDSMSATDDRRAVATEGVSAKDAAAPSSTNSTRRVMLIDKPTDNIEVQESSICNPDAPPAPSQFSTQAASSESSPQVSRGIAISENDWPPKNEETAIEQDSQNQSKSGKDPGKEITGNNQPPCGRPE